MILILISTLKVQANGVMYRLYRQVEKLIRVEAPKMIQLKTEQGRNRRLHQEHPLCNQAAPSRLNGIQLASNGP